MDLSSSKDGRVGTGETQESESCGGQTTNQKAGCPNEPIKTGLPEVGPDEPIKTGLSEVGADEPIKTGLSEVGPP